MPISRDQFDKGQDDTRYQILKFLKAHPDEAFEPKEIADEVYGWETPQDIGAGLIQLVGIVFGVGMALNDLVRQGSVDRRTIRVGTYYSIRRT